MDKELKGHLLYRKYDDGTEICWGFDIVCSNKGDCDSCDTMKRYVEYNNNDAMRRAIIIPNWINLKLTCVMCGETRSVKYKLGDQTFCNKCVLKAKKGIE